MQVHIYAIAQQLVTINPEVERSNISYKYFIDAFVEAFEALGGVAWAEKYKLEGPPPDEQADLEQALFASKFAMLSIDGDTEHLLSAITQNLDDIPVESYRIIQDEEGIITDYLMAVYALVQEWAGLRAYLQGLWQKVAHNGLNSAVAGALSNMAINIIECSVATIFIDFSGHDSYETIMSTITRGDPDKIQGMFRLALYKISPDQASTKKVQEAAVDIKKQFLIYAYRDFIDFVTDF
ncbi:hypothetical protein F5Y03DRAFT_401570 [Xylaria venustula]|nr:hypothetical protein F5Y03DRAFT_401570 [Xylaria venustula]